MLRIVSNWNVLFYQKTAKIIYQKQNTVNIHINRVSDFHSSLHFLVFYRKKYLFEPAGGAGQSFNTKFDLEHQYKIPEPDTARRR